MRFYIKDIPEHGYLNESKGRTTRPLGQEPRRLPIGSYGVYIE
jgi:hypothetical protein